MTRRPPNVLFLMSDEHRADFAGFAGHPHVRTPTLDALAATACRFDAAYTPSPICVPARQCVAAGKLPRACGVERYGQDLPPGSMTFARWFAAHGYETVCCGKLHHMGADQMQGWTQRPAGDLAVGADARGLRPDAYRPDASGGGGGGGKWSDAKEVRRAGTGRGPNDDTDALATEAALRFVDRWFTDPEYDRPRAQTPLLLKLSLCRPHYPYLTDPERFARFLNRVDPFVEEPPLDHPFLAGHRVAVGGDGPDAVSEREARRATAAYCGMIEQLDADLGRLVARLEHNGQDLDDWVVVYTSDHGEMLGQHGVWEKQVFFEGSARVPLLVKAPGQRAPARIPRNVSLCDLFATLCDLAGLPMPEASEAAGGPGFDSRSLAPLMRGEDPGWEDTAASEFGGTNLMLKRGSLKYHAYDRDDCRAPEHRELLFDLAADPTERTNAIADPAHAEALAGFRAERDRRGF